MFKLLLSGCYWTFFIFHIFFIIFFLKLIFQSANVAFFKLSLFYYISGYGSYKTLNRKCIFWLKWGINQACVSIHSQDTWSSHIFRVSVSTIKKTVRQVPAILESTYFFPFHFHFYTKPQLLRVSAYSSGNNRPPLIWCVNFLFICGKLMI